MRLLRQDLREMPPYEPIEPLEVLAQRLGMAEDAIVKLDGNENPYGPSPRVAEALAGYPHYHIYPDPLQRQVRRALADFLGLGVEHIVVGNGSDELLDLIGRAFLSPGDGVVNAPPTFGMYPFLARSYGARLIDVPRRDDYSLDLAGLAAAVRQGAKLLFLCSPNNPTGNALSPEELERLLALGAVVVVDEAYVEFDGEGFASLVPSRDNLIVLRTFSKWAGLAGLRAGYGVFPKAIAEVILKIKMPYNLNVAAQTAVLASLADADTLRQRVQAIVAERERLFERLARLPWLRLWPSQANFILCEVKGLDAGQVAQRLQTKGIFVRHFDTPQLQHCLRITVGKPEHSDRLLAALQEIGGSPGK